VNREPKMLTLTADVAPWDATCTSPVHTQVKYHE